MLNDKKLAAHFLFFLQLHYLNKFLYLILDYSHNHYTFKHFGV